MNIEADPLGYKLMSRQLSTIGTTNGELASRLQDMSLWLRTGVIAVMLLAGIALIGGLYLVRFIMVPMSAGIVIGFIFGPLGERAKARGISSVFVYALLVCGVCLMLALVALVAMPIGQSIVEAIPRAFERFATLSGKIGSWIETADQLTRSIAGAAAGSRASQGTSAVDVAALAISIVTPAISQIVILIFTLVLFLGGRSEIRASLAMLYADRDRRLAALRAFRRIENRLTNYFLAITAINLALGVTVAASFYGLGVKGAGGWGVMAFLLNYLPVVGPLTMKAGLLIFGVVVEPDLTRALLPCGVFLVISVIESNLITPRIIGNRITMNPLVVFVSVIFWTWLWGFAGAFMAMPLLAIARAVLDVTQEDSQQIPG